MNPEVKDVKRIIDERCESTKLGQVHSNNGNVTKTVDTSLIAKDIIAAGYHKIDDYEKMKSLLQEYMDGEIVNEDVFSQQVKDLQDMKVATLRKVMQILDSMYVPEDGKHEWRDYRNENLDKIKEKLKLEFGTEVMTE